MIDLETLGQYGNAIITSINAVQFDINTGETGKVFSQPVSIKDSVKSGLKIDPDTMIWWMRQNDEARTKFIEDDQKGKPLYESLKDFSWWLKHLPAATTRELIDIDNVFVWGRCPRFDMGILSTHYHSFGFHIPWNFRNELCVRTYEFVYPAIKYRTIRDGIEHSGVDDAKYQIKYVVEVNKFISNAKNGVLSIWK